MQRRSSKRALDIIGDALHPPGSAHLEGDPCDKCEPTPWRRKQHSQGLGIERLPHRDPDERQQGEQPRGGAWAGEFGGKSAAVLLRGSQRRGDLSHGCRKARSMVFGDLPANGQRTKTATSRSEEHTSELQSLRHLVCRLLL